MYRCQLVKHWLVGLDEVVEVCARIMPASEAGAALLQRPFVRRVLALANANHPCAGCGRGTSHLSQYSHAVCASARSHVRARTHLGG